MILPTDIQIILICYIAGAICKVVLPYIRKWYDSGKTLPFNPGFLVDLSLAILAGVAGAVADFSAWDIPFGALWFVCIIAFLTAAGLDAALQFLLKLAGFYPIIMEKTRGIIISVPRVVLTKLPRLPPKEPDRL